MRPIVSRELLGEVERLVISRNHDYLDIPRAAPVKLRPALAHAVLPEIRHFNYQMTRLQGSFRQQAAFFRDDGPKGDFLPLLVMVPDLDRPGESYDRLLFALNQSKIPIEGITSEQATQIFVARLSEFLASQLAPSTHIPRETIVHSNRSGDTVICAKGYFLSTGTAFGVSSPATGYLPQARYSFGIIDSGMHIFENIVWTCPTTLKINLP
jgi:hypothetical protein